MTTPTPLSLIGAKLRQAWSGKPGVPVSEWPDPWQELMRRQGFDEPASYRQHLLRLEERVAQLERRR